MCRDIHNNWLHGFAQAGMKALQDEFKARKLTSLDERAHFVERMIGDKDNLQLKLRPFLWLSEYDETSTTRRGVFRGKLVTRTLAHHLTLVTDHASHDFEFSREIKGALVMAIQSVLRALLYNVTGELEIPPGSGANFSSANWADLPKVDAVTKKKIIISRHTLWDSYIKELKLRDWQRIINESMVYCGKKKKDTESENESDIEVIIGEKEELYDPDMDPSLSY
ncbi:hypothetical protein BDQ17DRAFT_365562 [Cyathus striatus]|nr:hypothetical protein BDQ17DRAFT_365562 [Cyathus striatus]